MQVPQTRRTLGLNSQVNLMEDPQTRRTLGLIVVFKFIGKPNGGSENFGLGSVGELHFDNPLPVTFGDNRAMWLQRLHLEVKGTLTRLLDREWKKYAGVWVEEVMGNSNAEGLNDPASPSAIGSPLHERSPGSPPTFLQLASEGNPKREAHPSIIYHLSRLRFARCVDAIFARFGFSGKSNSSLSILNDTGLNNFEFHVQMLLQMVSLQYDV
jgi:hypothetical protein